MSPFISTRRGGCDLVIGVITGRIGARQATHWRTIRLDWRIPRRVQVSVVAIAVGSDR